MKITESKLRGIISRSIMESLYGDSVYSIYIDAYNINTGDIMNYNGDDDTFYSPEKAFETIKYMLTYPEGSFEHDLRYANDCVLILSICEEYSNGVDNNMDDKVYISAVDGEYADIIRQKLPGKEVVVL